MFLQLPKPYPDELLQSVCARLVAHRGAKLTVQFPCPLVSMKIDLPRGLDYIAQSVSHTWNDDAGSIAEKFTLFPFCSAFSTEAQKSDCLRLMKVHEPGAARNLTHRALGIAQSLKRHRDKLKYCPLCRKEDLKRYGETYWRRSHQLTGSSICLSHECFLASSQVLFRENPEWILLKDATLCTSDTAPQTPQDLTTREFAILREVSRRCKRLLDGVSTDWGYNTEEIKHKYRYGAIDLGIKHKGEQIIVSSLLDAFSGYFGTRVLEIVHCQADRYTSWLPRIFRKGKPSAIHPLHHVLIQTFLGEIRPRVHTLRMFPAAPWRCPNPFGAHSDEYPIKKVSVRADPSFGELVASANCTCGLSFMFRKATPSDPRMPEISKVNWYGTDWENAGIKLLESGTPLAAVAKQVGISVTTMRRIAHDKAATPSRTKTMQWRRIWKSGFKAPEMTSDLMRKRQPELYRNLRRYDRDWITNERRGLRCRSNQRIRRAPTDWGERDKIWAQKLETVINLPTANGYQIPRDQAQIAVAAGISPLTLRTKIEFLPLCSAVLQKIRRRRN
jgi:hypothetical protein